MKPPILSKGKKKKGNFLFFKSLFLIFLYRFNLNTQKWQKFKTSLPERAFHTSHVIDNMVWIFGGNDSKKVTSSLLWINLDSLEWSEVDPSCFQFEENSNWPEPRLIFHFFLIVFLLIFLFI